LPALLALVVEQTKERDVTVFVYTDAIVEEQDAADTEFEYALLAMDMASILTIIPFDVTRAAHPIYEIRVTPDYFTLRRHSYGSYAYSCPIVQVFPEVCAPCQNCALNGTKECTRSRVPHAPKDLLTACISASWFQDISTPTKNSRSTRAWAIAQRGPAPVRWRQGYEYRQLVDQRREAGEAAALTRMRARDMCTGCAVKCEAYKQKEQCTQFTSAEALAEAIRMRAGVSVEDAVLSSLMCEWGSKTKATVSAAPPLRKEYRLVMAGYGEWGWGYCLANANTHTEVLSARTFHSATDMLRSVEVSYPHLYADFCEYVRIKYTDMWRLFTDHPHVFPLWWAAVTNIKSRGYWSHNAYPTPIFPRAGFKALTVWVDGANHINYLLGRFADIHSVSWRGSVNDIALHCRHHHQVGEEARRDEGFGRTESHAGCFRVKFTA
jgi:hypothetical protein